jgi:hypothetical protein
VSNSTGSNSEKRQGGDRAKDRYAALIESLLQDEIRRLERAVLSEWEVELRALQTASV